MTRLACLAAALAAVACAPRAFVRPAVVVVDVPAPPGPPPPEREAVEGTPAPPPPPDLARVLAVAREHVGRSEVRVNGAAFRYDCSGFVRGVFSTLDLDLFALGDELPGANGVLLIFRWFERHGENHFRRLPDPGDLVYFDNTYDLNRNHLVDDPLTHVGIVDEVRADGTFFVIHRSSRGIVRDPMNLLRPGDRHDEQGQPINAWLRPRTRRDPPGTLHLMGELFAGFGRIKAAGPDPLLSSPGLPAAPVAAASPAPCAREPSAPLLR